MSHDPRRVVRLAVLAALGFALPASAVELAVPNIGVESGLESAAAPAALIGASFPALSASFAPAAFAPAAAPSLGLPVAISAAAPAPVFAAPAGASPAPAPAAAPRGTPALDALRFASASGASAGARFDGSRDAAPAAAQGPSKGPSGFIKNADGVWVGGRVAEQALWINRLSAELSSRVQLGDVMNVMDDAYDEGRVKLANVERSSRDRKLSESSVHLEGTRNWIDAILTDQDGRSIAVHTHRVFFHPAPGNPASEISEGIRRVDKYLDKAKADMGPGGSAEQDLKKRFAAVELYFDTRGYKEIEDHIRGREAEFRAAYGDRFRFGYVTEPKSTPARSRADYNRLVEKYKDQPEGLMGILDGVTYSREVGVGHELNSHKKRIQMGLRITQAGRDFFGPRVLPDGRTSGEEYKTEFDAVTEPEADAAKPASDRDVVLWEDKSVRVWMPLEKVMEDTFLYKLRIYRDNRAIIEKSLGGAPLKVVFSVDVGGLNRRAAKQGVLVWHDLRQKDLMDHLTAAGPELSKEYGFPVSFVFINSHPGEDSDLFSKEPVDEGVWLASQRGGNGRKHGARSRR